MENETIVEEKKVADSQISVKFETKKKLYAMKKMGENWDDLLNRVVNWQTE
jgi:hypothetical protein